MTAIMEDGYQTLVSFAADATVLFEEKTVTPPGVDGGGSTDTTTMLNTLYRTFAPKALITLTESSMTVAYDPETITTEIIANLINVNNLITLTFPDGDTLAFYGWLDKFIPGEHVEGEQPTAEITIVPSNRNASLVETAPVHTPAA